MTQAQRGYDYNHKKLRRQLEPDVNAGRAKCWRCVANGITDGTEQIKPGQPWDLGHDDNDRTKYRGPEHQHCNRATATRRTTPTGPPIDTSRHW